MKHVKCYTENYLRPMMVRNNFMLLDGQWDFAFDDDNMGIDTEWFLKFPNLQKINVPFSYQTKMSGIGDCEAHPYIWYKRTVTYDLKNLGNNRLIINFEGVDYLSEVWVNGIFIGEHKGGYCRHSYDITNSVKSKNGTAEIVVRAEDTFDATQPRGKQKWLDKPFGCWYNETNGIWKSVWTEFVSKTYIKKIKLTPMPDSFFLAVEIELNEYAKEMRADINISFDGDAVCNIGGSFIRKKLSMKIDMTNDIDSFKIHTWSCEKPNLYDIEIKLFDNKEEIDSIGSYFGFRNFFARGNMLILNQNPIYLKMVLAQCYYEFSGMTAPNEKALADDILLIKKLGFNGVRMHQKLEDERFIYNADIAGLLVWAEMPSPYEFDDNMITAIINEWSEAVRQYYNHPSVVTWVPINESWGLQRIVKNKSQQKLSEALVNITKAIDPYRPVISNDGWEHTESDIVTLHNYSQSSKELKHFYDNLDTVLAGGYIVDYSQWRPVFADGYSYSGQPVIISEFAGIGYENNCDNIGWGYGDKVTTAIQYVERLSELVGALRQNDKICGFCITQFTDVEAEINGLTDIRRIPKADIKLLNKAITQK